MPNPATKRPVPPAKRRYDGPDPTGRVIIRLGNDGERVVTWEGGPLARLDSELATDIDLIRWLAPDLITIGPYTCRVLGYSWATDDLVVAQEEDKNGRT
jgi:sugar/nucleoside kinase (ribokinase family)